MRRAEAAALLVAGLLLAGCGDDGGGPGETAPTETTTLDPGVAFESDVTAPTTAAPGAPTTTVPEAADVESRPGEVPSEFPSGFPVPDVAVVEIGSVGRAEGELRVAVDYAVDDEPSEVLDFYRDAVADAGHDVLLDDDDGAGQQFIGQLVFETDTYVGNVLVSGDGADGTLLTLTATLPD